MELRLRRRKPGETLSALHQDIRKLMALAHPTLPQEARESIACDHYIDALDDDEFGLKVRERASASLDEALCRVHTREACRVHAGCMRPCMKAAVRSYAAFIRSYAGCIPA